MTVVQKKLDGIIAISNYLKNYYKSCKNVVVIPPLVDFCEEKWSVEAENLGEGVNFIYSGQPGKKDKIGEIVTAFSKVAENGNCKLFVVGCPKLDMIDYSAKLTEIIRNNNIRSITVVRMEVPCCGGIEMAVKNALQNSGKFLPWNVVTISTDGKIM